MSEEERALKEIVDDENDMCIDSIEWRTIKGERRLIAWISLMWIQEFVEKIRTIFGDDFFSEGGVEAMIQSDCIAIDMSEWFDCYCDLNLVYADDGRD